MRIKRFLIGISPIVLVVTGTLSCVTQPLVRPDASGAVTVDQRALERHVRMLAVTLHPRSIDNLTNLDLAADYVLEQLRATGAETAEQLVQADGKQFRNLIARFGPREGPVVVIGAHYDSCGDTPGADDNASGVAGLLELARLLARIHRHMPSNWWPTRSRNHRTSAPIPWAASGTPERCRKQSARCG